MSLNANSHFIHNILRQHKQLLKAETTFCFLQCRKATHVEQVTVLHLITILKSLQLKKTKNQKKPPQKKHNFSLWPFSSTARYLRQSAKTSFWSFIYLFIFFWERIQFKCLFAKRHICNWGQDPFICACWLNLDCVKIKDEWMRNYSQCERMRDGEIHLCLCMQAQCPVL